MSKAILTRTSFEVMPSITEVCDECYGDGVVKVRVTRSMALDAGDAKLEGQHYAVRCERCNGEGIR